MSLLSDLSDWAEVRAEGASEVAQGFHDAKGYTDQIMVDALAVGVSEVRTRSTEKLGDTLVGTSHLAAKIAEGLEGSEAPGAGRVQAGLDIYSQGAEALGTNLQETSKSEREAYRNELALDIMDGADALNFATLGAMELFGAPVDGSDERQLEILQDRYNDPSLTMDDWAAMADILTNVGTKGRFPVAGKVAQRLTGVDPQDLADKQEAHRIRMQNVQFERSRSARQEYTTNAEHMANPIGRAKRLLGTLDMVTESGGDEIKVEVRNQLGETPDAAYSRVRAESAKRWPDRVGVPVYHWAVITDHSV